MTQTATPKSDDSTGRWTPTPLAPVINSGGVVSGDLPPNDAFQVKLTALAWPAPGPEVLTVGLSGDGSTDVAVVLLQGAQVIAAKSLKPGAGDSCTITLTDAQRALITDYADLHVAVTAGTHPACCTNELPGVLHATLSGGTGGCSCLDGVQVTLVWDGSNWKGTFTACGGTSVLAMLTDCSGGIAGQSPNACSTALWGFSVQSCSPFSATLTAPVSGCCTGSITITITE
jgi:hypothetical protein